MGTVVLIAFLILLGLILFTFELVTPSFGLLTVLAVSAFGLAAWQAFMLSSMFGVILIVVLLVAVPAYLISMVKYLPKTRLGSWIFLKSAEAAGTDGTPEADDNAALVGKTGTTETLLRPSGAVRVEGHRVVALAESGLIEKGKTVKVIRASGTNVTVREV